MKFALPDQFEFKSADNKYQLFYTPKKDPYVKGPKEKWVWKGVRPEYPSEVLLAPKANVVYFIGSYGDAGVGMGIVTVYDIKTGKLIREYELKKNIPNLEELSRAYRDATNFPWISSAKVLDDGKNLEIKVCDQMIVTIDPKNEEPKIAKDLHWFKKFGCEELRIKDYGNLSSKTVKKEIIIKDPEYIRSLQTSINQFPVEGEMMVDMNENAEYLTLEFLCGSSKEIIEFYDSRIKTPDTSFYMRSDKHEKSIWEEIQSLFAKPQPGKSTPFFVGHKLDFGDFSLTYKGSEDKTPEGTTATSWVQSFQLQSTKDKSEKMIEVRSGQLPPKSVEFEINKKKYVLHTFTFKKNRLEPRHLVVEKK